MSKQNCYVWYGINQQGEAINGEMFAITKSVVKLTLLQQNIFVLRINQKKKSSLYIWRQRITQKQLRNFTQQLKNMLSAGISILPALNTIHDNENHVQWREVLSKLKKQVATGYPLSEAMMKYPKFFDTFFCNLIYAGEQTGKLVLVLESIAIYQEKMLALKNKINKAITYPIVVILVAIIITLFLCVFVVPQFETVFASFGASLPLLTKAIVVIANGLRHYGINLIFGLIGIIIILKISYKKSSYFRLRLEDCLLSMPFIGHVLKTAIIARCLKTLAIALRAGITLPMALVLASKVAGKYIYHAGFLKIEADIIAGERFHKAMQNSQLFTAEIIAMIAISEEAGTLTEMIEKIAEINASKVDDNLDLLTRLLEPAIMLVLSIIVGTLILAMYLPIFQLGGVI